MLFFAALLACASHADPDEPKAEKTGKKGKKKHGAESALVEWPAVPADLRAADEALMSGELAKVKTAAAARPLPQVGGAGAGNVLVVVLDTVRADHLGMYGYDRGTTPNLDRWAAGAHIWDNAETDAPWTLPAHASMFTGKTQREHAARSLGKDDDRKAAPLAASYVTIAERLQAAGYRTVGVAGNRAFLHPSFGVAQGFDAWIDEQPLDDSRKVPYTPADRIIPMALSAVAQADEHPLFLFVNLMDAHTPYKARVGYVKEPDKLKRASIPGNKGFRKVAEKLLSGGGPVDPAIAASWSEAYDAELRFEDEQLAKLLEATASFPHVFVLADHGEYLGEHGLVEHAKDVYEPVTHVPFLAKDARFPPGHDPALIQTHDLAWMVLGAAGLDDPGALRTDGLAVTELTYTLKKDLDADYGKRFDRIRRAYRIGPQKLILGTDGSSERYDLTKDPGELHPILGLPDLFEGVAEKWLAAHAEAPVVSAAESGPLGPDEEALKALGYAE